MDGNPCEKATRTALTKAHSGFLALLVLLKQEEHSRLSVLMISVDCHPIQHCPTWRAKTAPH